MKIHPYRLRDRQEFDNFLLRAQSLIPQDELLRVDLHCHDAGSDVSNNPLGRLLGVPETWTSTEEVLKTQRFHGMDVHTVTNHNSARSCWKQLDKGVELLVGAEWSCRLPKYGTDHHVLAYGFTPEQEPRLEALRSDIRRFAEYCAAEDIPTVLAHPLRFHSAEGVPPQELMDHLALLFERFEGVNGQLDTRQNLLTAAWVEAMDEETLSEMARRTGVPIDAVCHEPFVKRLTGGSDDHFAMFTGTIGTCLHVPGLCARLAHGETRTSLALEALRRGATAPFGAAGDGERLAAAFLNYSCQLALHTEDPGLSQILLSPAEFSDKLLALGISNAVSELHRSRIAPLVLRTFCGALHGEIPPMYQRTLAGRKFRPVLRHLTDVARAHRQGAEAFQACLHQALPKLFHDLTIIVTTKANRNLRKQRPRPEPAPGSAKISVKIPSQIRTLLKKNGRHNSPSAIQLGRLFAGLPIPLLATLAVGGNLFAAVKAQNRDRRFSDAFAKRLGKFDAPRRTLWITDTLGDRNGIAHALESVLQELRDRELPVDILTCSSTLEEGPHLRILKPVAEFALPFYQGQTLRVPDYAEMFRVFQQGGYDRIVSSTEGPMGIGALLLHKAFDAPAHFFLHTDWLDFGRHRLGLSEDTIARIGLIVRAWLQAHDGVFVLNREQEEWLRTPAMGFSASQIHRTAHWPDPLFRPQTIRREVNFPGVAPDEPVLLFAGRLSEEKGVLELAGILAKVRQVHPKTRLVLCGTGPAEERLRQDLADAVFMGWVDKATLAHCYAAADLLLLPSHFDTFGCVVLEAMACGLPVLAYASKGPADIVEPSISGFLSKDGDEMACQAVQILSDNALHQHLRAGAAHRAAQYNPIAIMDDLLQAMDVSQNQTSPPPEPLAGVTSMWAELLGIFDGGNRSA